MMEEDMLHTLGNEVTAERMETGYLATHEEFENVHIRVEYKWGVKRFPPQTLAKRDNGILYGLVGADSFGLPVSNARLKKTIWAMPTW